MPSPRVSVVIDNYNYARFLPDAIDSVFRQDFPAGELELIVVDDGSTDGSREVLARYGGKLSSVLQTNQGYAAAFNAGIARARGAVVCLLDADDVWLPGKLARVVRRFEAEPELSMVQHFLQDADAGLKPLPVEFPNWPARTTLEDYLDGRAEFTATSGLSFRKEALAAALPLPVELRFLYADDLLTVRALARGPAGNIAEPLGLHRVHGANFCAGTLSDPKKLASDLSMRRVYRENVDRLLAALGRKPGARLRKLEELELLRREILLHAYEGRRFSAFGAWLNGLRRASATPFGLFRVLSCAVAVCSPRLYLGLYARYARSRALKTLRRVLLPS